MTVHKKQNYWRSVFQSQRASGLTIVNFCKHQKINISTYYAWRKKLADEAQEPKPRSHQLVPLFVSELENEQDSPITITTPSGYQLAFSEKANIENLHQILGLLA
jgi:hypothetical protein